MLGRSWWPDWRNKLLWQVGIVLGSVNGVYFGSNTFLPGYLTDVGRPDLIGGALTALNFGQLPASFALLAVASDRAPRLAVHAVRRAHARVPRRHRHHRERLDRLLCRRARLLGAVVLTLGFALPALLSDSSDVARMAAAMFTSVTRRPSLLPCSAAPPGTWAAARALRSCRSR